MPKMLFFVHFHFRSDRFTNRAAVLRWSWTFSNVRSKLKSIGNRTTVQCNVPSGTSNSLRWYIFRSTTKATEVLGREKKRLFSQNIILWESSGLENFQLSFRASYITSIFQFSYITSIIICLLLATTIGGTSNTSSTALVLSKYWKNIQLNTLPFF